MKVLVATLGSAGDLHPFLAVARALHESGTEVLFLSAEPHREAVEAEGLRFAPILARHDHERTLEHPALWHPIRGFGVLWRHMAVRSVDATVSLLEDEVARSGGQRVRVFASPLVLGARLAADVLPIDLITGHTAPAGLRSCQDPMFVAGHLVPRWTPMAVRKGLWRWLDRNKLEPMAAPVIGRWRAARGLPPLQEPVFARWMHSPQRVLGLFPPDFGPMPSDWPVPVDCVGFPLFQASQPPFADEALNAWLDTARRGGPKPLTFYPGSAPTRAADTIRGAALALSSPQQPVLLVDSGQPQRDEPHMLIRAQVHLPSTLSQSAGFVHHGGIGACAQGLAAGVKQWICPSAYDQHDNAWRIAQLSRRPFKDVAPPVQQLSTNLRKALTRINAGSPPTDRVLKQLAQSTANHPNDAVRRAVAILTAPLAR